MSDSPLNTSKSLSGTESTASIITKEYVQRTDMIFPVMRSNFRRSFVILVLVAIGAGALGSSRNGSPNINILFTLGIYMSAVIFVSYRNRMKNTKENLERSEASAPSQHNEISDQFFAIYFSDGTFFKNSIDGLFRHVERHADYYLCHMKKVNGYNFIPLDAFASEADRQRFEAILRQHKVLVVNKK